MKSVTSRSVVPAVVLGLSSVILLSGCSGIVPLEAAPDANNPACADLTVRLPSEVAELPKRTTNAQSTGAWGDPAAILLTCGIEATGPTTLPCITVDGVDWIRDDSQAPLFRFEAYGRSPGVEVVIDADADVSGTTALVDLNSAISVLPQERKCIGAVDAGAIPDNAEDGATVEAP